MLDDNTKYVVIKTGYENNILANNPNFYKCFNSTHYSKMILFVAKNNIYKPNYINNKWDRNTHNYEEYNLILKLKNLNIDSFIIFEILESGTHNYDTILKLLSDVQDLDICSVFGIEYFDFTSLNEYVIVSFDCEAG